MGSSMSKDTALRNSAPEDAAVTCGPIQGSTKTYVDVDGMAVPYRRVHLTNGECLDLYDTSGPYTDDSADIDLERGLAPTRDTWARPAPVTVEATGTTASTQLAWARQGS